MYVPVSIKPQLHELIEKYKPELDEAFLDYFTNLNDCSCSNSTLERSIFHLRTELQRMLTVINNNTKLGI